MESAAAAVRAPGSATYRKQRIRRMAKNRWLYLMLLPGILYFLIFKYVSMYGVLIAFKNYQPFLGFWDSEWVGMKHFNRFFGDSLFWRLFKNTFLLAIYNIVFFFPLPIAIALMLNELRLELFKRTIQTIVYIPHFMSWVVIVSIGLYRLSSLRQCQRGAVQ
ncbi:putative multiple-sugar transport system permease YteP [Paenibacillus konkukensis]|uniref:Multiple-sugar transport system permease YteP n=1 Tax=Paenibacillus konkukensis TaxID=2020716 RepID=A0ABY4RPN4_9BACL|nr:putative multiple-sugar transport system permease YteP [Paenibacillus konkukensis]